jgi:8-oxo-dGTP pyrophosphatase MutT (NUDIX family)
VRGIEPEKGRMDLPGGFVEVGEHPRDALAREAREELGVEVEVEERPMLLAVHTYGADGEYVLAIGFRARIISGSMPRTVTSTRSPSTMAAPTAGEEFLYQDRPHKGQVTPPLARASPNFVPSAGQKRYGSVDEKETVSEAAFFPRLTTYDSRYRSDPSHPAPYQLFGDARELVHAPDDLDAVAQRLVERHVAGA